MSLVASGRRKAVARRGKAMTSMAAMDTLDFFHKQTLKTTSNEGEQEYIASNTFIIVTMLYISP